jgi:hypothetical protein
MISNRIGGLYWLEGAMAIATCAGLINSWVLLVEILLNLHRSGSGFRSFSARSARLIPDGESPHQRDHDQGGVIRLTIGSDRYGDSYN